MTAAAHLWAVGYDNIAGADVLRDEVNKLGAEHCLILMDTAVVVRYADGTANLNGEPFYVATDVREGRYAGLLAGVALAAPILTSGAVATVLKSSTSIAADVGIADNFICEIERLMRPGTSALFVLDQVGDMDQILQGIRGLGGTVLKTTVDLERAKLIQSTLAASTGHVALDAKLGRQVQ
jgi:uncharacterized membrane protein